jgi:hypothetical protein
MMMMLRRRAVEGRRKIAMTPLPEWPATMRLLQNDDPARRIFLGSGAGQICQS